MKPPTQQDAERDRGADSDLLEDVGGGGAAEVAEQAVCERPGDRAGSVVEEEQR